jgi:hypothetical protein
MLTNGPPFMDPPGARPRERRRARPGSAAETASRPVPRTAAAANELTDPSLDHLALPLEPLTHRLARPKRLGPGSRHTIVRRRRWSWSGTR